MGRIAGPFKRVEPRRRAGRRLLLLGLLSDLPRKNCWTIAEWAGEASPHGMQHLLCRAVWDADAVRTLRGEAWWCIRSANSPDRGRPERPRRRHLPSCGRHCAA
jgi:hypothetical protein